VVGEVKIKTEVSELCKDIPVEFCDILNYLRKVDFQQEPNYDLIQSFIRSAAGQNGIKLDNIFEWSPRGSIQGTLNGTLQSKIY
jgi:hypothetical protein